MIARRRIARVRRIGMRPQLAGGGVLAPPAPTGLVATGTGSGVDLAWDTALGVTWRVYRRVADDGGAYTRIATGLSSSSYSDSTAADSTDYDYYVTASAGGESTASGTVTCRKWGVLATAPWVYWFEQHELSTGNLVDAVTGSYTLTANNAPGFNAGDHYASRELVSASHTYFEGGDTAALNLAGKDWTVCGRTLLKESMRTSGKNITLFGSIKSDESDYKWKVNYYDPGPEFRFSAGSGVAVFNDSSVGLYGQWLRWVAWYTNSDQTLHLRINGSTAYTASVGAIGHDATFKLRIGGSTDASCPSAYGEHYALASSAPGAGGALSTAQQDAWMATDDRGSGYKGRTPQGRSLYYAAAGNDSTGTGTQANPWQTSDKMEAVRILPRDYHYFKGGDNFDLFEVVQPNGNYALPGLITRYGTGQPHFDASASYCLIDGSMIQVDNVEIEGSGAASTSPGILFRNARRNRTALANLPQRGAKITNCTVHGAYLPINMTGSQTDPINGLVSDAYSGWYDSEASSNHVYNGRILGIMCAAVASWDAGPLCKRVNFFNNYIHDMAGVPATISGFGGIFFGHEDSNAYQNRILDIGGVGYGGVGFMFFMCDGCRMYQNGARHLQDPDGVDGDGLGLDKHCLNNTVEQNLASDCDGAGLQLFLTTTNRTGVWTNNVCRYNLSINCGLVRSGHASGGSLTYDTQAGRVADGAVNYFYGNTIYKDHTLGGSVQGIVQSDAQNDPSSFVLANNLLILTGPSSYGIASAGTEAVRIIQNLYDMTGGFRVEYKGVIYTDLATLHGVGGEQYGGVNYGIVAPAALVNAGYDAEAFPVTDMTAYDPTSSSPSVQAGVDLNALFGHDMGAEDFHGNPNTTGGNHDIGAVQYQSAANPKPYNLTASTPPNTVLLKWSYAPGATWNIYRRVSGVGSYVALHTGQATNAYTDATGVVGTAYDYQVTAVRSAVESSASDPVTATVAGMPSGLLGWWKADAGTYQDSGLTTPATANNDPVGGWVDQSGNGHNALQATSGDRPLLKTSQLNGLPSLRFDGVNDYLGSFTAAYTSFTAFVVFKSAADSVGLMGGGGGAQPQLTYTASSRKLAVYDGTQIFSDAFTTASGSWQLGEVRYTGGVVAFWENGTARGGGSLTMSTSFGAIGTLIPGAGQLNGDIAEILFFDAALSTGNRQSVESYLGAKYNLF